MKKITKITVERIADEYPNINYLGEYADKPNSDYSIERESCGAREFRYFNPNWENYKGCDEEEIRKYCQQDYERMESLNAGKWCYIGIKAVAEIQTSGNGKIWLCNEISTGGLWGIESDSGEDYLKSEGNIELSELEKLLIEFGFSENEINEARRNLVEA